MKVALVQINPTIGDFRGNLTAIRKGVARAAEAGADLAVTSEMSLVGYPPRDLVERHGFVEGAARALEALRRDPPAVPVVVGSIERSPHPAGKPLRNVAVLVDTTGAARVAAKALLPTYDVFDEHRHFEPGREPAVFPVGGVNVGLSVCEDLWYDRFKESGHLYDWDPVAAAVELGADVLVNVSASPYDTTKIADRAALVREKARAAGRPIVYVNQVGGNDELVFDGGSMVVGARGEVLARAHHFAEDVVVVDMDGPAGPVREAPGTTAAEVRAALELGTRDFVRKCGLGRVTIGLSGGIDSSVVAVIAARALGPAAVTGVAMPGPFSSPKSLENARELARSLGIEFLVVPIDRMFEAAKEALAPAFEGRESDHTEENMQARLRGLVLMALSNKSGTMVLTTGNTSEAGVGYATLYGDMCGGLAVISDVPKTMVYELARHLNDLGPAIPEDAVTRAPSAELRPDQKDEDTLPPYKDLDPILTAYVEGALDPAAIARRGFDPDLVARVVRMVDRAEYKRRQAAPGLRVTTKAFGIGRRIPIAERYDATDPCQGL